ncbi:hypothetical protein PPN85_13630 [Proteus mirabilis]|uniref:hypothetical protein n=1 Tax=Proteus mirabilis TaxID=584 RepID=UPI00234993B7|nr:hypothetical protein [Proteus mirabilis]MDC5934371.1 hypothetical protein [Proteus mirabilis]
MKTNYFTYRYLPVDGYVPSESLKDTIDSMLSNENNTLTIGGEYHIIQHVDGDVYSLIKTNSRDIFRKLDVRSNSCVDLSSILSANEKIAFASFFILKEGLIGFSNTQSSPRISRLAEIYDHFMFTQNSNHNINFQPVTKDVTAQDAMQFAHVGRITMKVDRSQGIMGAISEWFNGDVRYDDVASFEIKIIPARGADIKNTFADVMNDLPQEVRSIAISAKENIGDSASDSEYYFSKHCL